MFVHVNTVVHITAHIFARHGFRFLCVWWADYGKNAEVQFEEVCCKITSVVACRAKLPHVQTLQLNFKPLPHSHSNL